MSTPLQVGDAAQLINGYTPTYTIASINEENQTVKCVWYDTKKRETKIENIPLSALKKAPDKKPLDLDGLRF